MNALMDAAMRDLYVSSVNRAATGIDRTADLQIAADAGYGFLPNGVYDTTKINVTRPLTLVGESDLGVIVQGPGDLFELVNGQSALNFSNLTLRNKGERAALIRKSYTGHGVASFFDNVNFGAAQCHIETVAVDPDSGDVVPGAGIVGWRLNNCRFIDAALASRRHGSLWCYSEVGCYTWYSAKGLTGVGNLSSVSLRDSVFEWNLAEAIEIILAQGMECRGLKLDVVHLESNGSADPCPAIVLDQMVDALGYESVLLTACKTFAESAHPNIRIGDAVRRIDMHLKACKGITYSPPPNGCIFTDDNYSPHFGVVGNKVVKREHGTLDGNLALQIGDVPLAPGESHRVIILPKASVTPGVMYFQDMLISRTDDGTMQVLKLDDVGDCGCDLVIGDGRYSVVNKNNMSTSIQPKISITGA